MDVLFLDANVLFSAAYRVDAGLRRLWDLEDARLITSAYAAEEARRNLHQAKQWERLERLLGSVQLVQEVPAPESADDPLVRDVELPAKDVPILRAAVANGATHLLTGDITHFGPYLGRAVAGVRVVTPAGYLRKR